MKKFFVLAFSVLALGLGGLAVAQEHPGSEVSESSWTLHGLYVEPNVSAFIPFNDDLSSGVYAGGKVGYQWNEWLGLEAEVGWANLDFEGDAGDVTTVPLLFNARLTLWPGEYVVDPYLFGGVGVGFNSIDAGSGVEIDNSLAGQIGGGVEYHINEWLSAYLDARFYFNNPDLNVPVLGEEDVELNAFLIGGGVVWRI